MRIKAGIESYIGTKDSNEGTDYHDVGQAKNEAEFDEEEDARNAMRHFLHTWQYPAHSARCIATRAATGCCVMQQVMAVRPVPPCCIVPQSLVPLSVTKRLPFCATALPLFSVCCRTLYCYQVLHCFVVQCGQTLHHVVRAGMRVQREAASKFGYACTSFGWRPSSVPAQMAPPL